MCNLLRTKVSHDILRISKTKLGERVMTFQDAQDAVLQKLVEWHEEDPTCTTNDANRLALELKQAKHEIKAIVEDFADSAIITFTQTYNDTGTVYLTPGQYARLRTGMESGPTEPNKRIGF